MFVSYSFIFLIAYNVPFTNKNVHSTAKNGLYFSFAYFAYVSHFTLCTPKTWSDVFIKDNTKQTAEPMKREKQDEKFII